MYSRTYTAILETYDEKRQPPKAVPLVRPSDAPHDGSGIRGARLRGGATPVYAQDKEVTIAYQQIVDPWVVAIASGSIEKETGYKINWRQFESGAKVATAMASGDVKVGVIGSSPLAAAVSQGLDLQLFWILDNINQAEAMVVRNGSGITKPSDLKGKTIGVPFVSTTHYHTMFALQHWGINPSEVKILNMQPNQLVAAWERGDIDAAYVWDPALARIEEERQGPDYVRRPVEARQTDLRRHCCRSPMGRGA